MTELSDPEPPTMYQVLIPIVLVLCSLAFILNFLIFLLLLMSKCRRDAIIVLTAGLAASDMESCISFALGFVVHSYVPIVLKVDLSDYNCQLVIIEVFRLGAVITSVYHLVALAALHYMVISCPLQMSAIQLNSYHLKGFICSAFILPPLVLASVLYSDVLFTDSDAELTCADLVMLRYGSFLFKVILFSIIFVFPFTCIAALYVAMLWRIRQAAKSSKSSRRKDSRERRTIATTAMFLVSFFVGWLPSTVLFVLMCNRCQTKLFMDEHPTLMLSVSIPANILILMKFLTNPIIYATRIPCLKRQFHKWRRSFDHHQMSFDRIFSFAPPNTLLQ